MGAVVVAGASLQCPFGTVPATLSVTSQGSVLAEGKPVATIQDFAPAVNMVKIFIFRRGKDKAM